MREPRSLDQPRAGGLAALAFAACLATTPLAGAPPAAAATLFGLVNTGELHASTDEGATWTPIAALPVRDAVGLAARQSSSDLFLASASGVLHRSTDSGASWSAVGAVPASDVVDLAITGSGTVLLFTATGALFQSNDLGETFTALAALTGSDFVSVAVAPGQKLYALTRTGAVYESTDGGTNWVAKGAIAVSDAARLRAFGGALFVLSGAGDVYRSDDAGVSWTPVSTLSQVGMRGLAPLDNVLAAASREGHCWTSPDGVTWTARGSINQLTLTALASDVVTTTGVEPGAIAGVRLGVPYPNPTRGAASFALVLAEAAELKLGLYDLAGRRVARSAPRRYPAGSHVVTWNPGVQAPGLYFLRVRAGSDFSAVHRWLVMR